MTFHIRYYWLAMYTIADKKVKSILKDAKLNKGAFTNYVYKICLFLTTYPPPLVNVVCERPLNSPLHKDKTKIDLL